MSSVVVVFEASCTEACTRTGALATGPTFTTGKGAEARAPCRSVSGSAARPDGSSTSSGTPAWVTLHCLSCGAVRAVESDKVARRYRYGWVAASIEPSDRSPDGPARSSMRTVESAASTSISTASAASGAVPVQRSVCHSLAGPIRGERVVPDGYEKNTSSCWPTWLVSGRTCSTVASGWPLRAFRVQRSLYDSVSIASLCGASVIGEVPRSSNSDTTSSGMVGPLCRARCRVRTKT